MLHSHRRIRGAGILPIIVAATASAVLAAGATFFLSRKAGGGKVGKDRARPKPVSVIYDMSDFTVNLAEPGRYIKASISLDLEAPAGAPSSESKSHEEAKPASDGHGSGEKKESANNLHLLPAPVSKELEDRGPVLRDTMIEQLSSASFRALLTPEGKQRLKSNLKAALNDELKACQVRKVYFTNFTMQ